MELPEQTKLKNLVDEGKEKLVSRIAYFQKLLKTLREALVRLQKITPGNELYEPLRDSLIKRFEYCIDMFWKMLREFIIEQHGVDVPASPKAVVKVAFDLSIITDDQHKEFILAINDRNLTSHSYHEEVAQQIAAHVIHYYQSMHAIAQALERVV
jgi:nucleotidyltransferase substrate binding protein (TIGR01987 family)